MTETELLEQANVQEVIEALRHPDPDPANLPATIPAELLQEQVIAERILRSSLTLDSWIEAQKVRMQRDIQDWQTSIATLELKRKMWRDMVRAWMERNDVRQIKTPWFTASLTKGRVKKIVTDEEGAISICKGIYPKAVKVKESLIKAEFDVACDTFPEKLNGVFTQEVGEPVLTVRKTKE